MPRVSKVEDPALPMVDPDGTDRRFTEVTVRFNDGRTLKSRVDRLRGSGADPLTDEEIGEKFLQCSRGVLPSDQQDAVLSMLQRLETLEDVSGPMRAASGAEVRRALSS